jgi:ABC-2 type transport system ATP-binding protein
LLEAEHNGEFGVHQHEHLAIEINQLTKVYDVRSKKPITAVDNLDLQITPGQVFGFLGANGAGKTTTIKMLCGLVKPTAGTMKLNGYDVARQRGQAMRQIGAVLEGTRNVYWRLSALENVMYFGRLKGVHGRGLRERAETLVHELDLWERRNDKIRNFSRGMQQKVAIACALISDPPIVLLDEPTLGLDVKASLTIKKWIAMLAQEQQKTVILTTHQLDMAQQLCDRVAIINQGRLLINAPTTDLLGLFRSAFYEIKVRGSLNGHLSGLPEALTVTQDTEELTVLSGAIDSQDELYGILTSLRHLNIPLVSVMPVEPNLEQVFINYLNEEVTV